MIIGSQKNNDEEGGEGKFSVQAYTYMYRTLSTLDFFRRKCDLIDVGI